MRPSLHCQSTCASVRNSNFRFAIFNIAAVSKAKLAITLEILFCIAEKPRYCDNAVSGFSLWLRLMDFHCPHGSHKLTSAGNPCFVYSSNFNSLMSRKHYQASWHSTALILTGFQSWLIYGQL